MAVMPAIELRRELDAFAAANQIPWGQFTRRCRRFFHKLFTA